jgi:hypothetical protein
MAKDPEPLDNELRQTIPDAEPSLTPKEERMIFVALTQVQQVLTVFVHFD